ncbi:MAG: sigma-70 family RNA polymerase sigma factor [Solirubrobacteraceae bacterium]
MAVTARPAVQNADDSELVAAVRDGDDPAFELLFARYQARISAYVRGRVHDHGRAEDITQEVFIAALRRLRATDSDIAFKPWIFEIAKNACIDAFRRWSIAQEVSFDAEDAFDTADQWRLAATSPAPDVVMDDKLALADLCGAFGGLSQTHHDILVKRELEGLSYRQIGEQLRMSQAAVESTLFRARRRLGEEYEEISSGQRCARVRDMVDAASSVDPAGSRPRGSREQRRICRHVARCQPCRRYALHAGVDIGVASVPGTRISKVAALLPLPVFMRRRPDVEPVAPLIAPHAQAAQIVGSLDPAAVSGWGKAVLAAVAVAVAGMGAGAAVDKRDQLLDFGKRAPAVIAPSGDDASGNATRPGQQEPAEQRVPAGSTSAESPEVTGTSQRIESRAPATRARPGSKKTSPPPRGAQGRAPAKAAPSKPGTPKPKSARQDPVAASVKPIVRPLRKVVEGVDVEGGKKNVKLPEGAKEVTGAQAGVGAMVSGGEDASASGGSQQTAGKLVTGSDPVTAVRDVAGALTAGSG